MKWGWTTSSDNLKSVFPLQDTFNNYFYNNGKYSKNKFIMNVQKK